MCPKIYSAYLVYSSAEKKQHHSDNTRRKKDVKENYLCLKVTVMTPDSDDTIQKSISKLNKIIFYGDSDSGS